MERAVSVRVLRGDCRSVLTALLDQSAHCCVTSPPYFGLRDYGVDEQIGLEPTPDVYVATMVEVFREVRRVLRDDGTLWLNLGDCYSQSGNNGNAPDSGYTKQRTNKGQRPSQKLTAGMKPKDLIGIPWRVAFALQADGWYLRSEIVWHKPNCMPESVTDRPTCAHEKIFLFAKSQRYYYDKDAIAEDAIYSGITGMDETGYKDAESFEGKHRRSDKQRGHSRRHAGFNDRWDAMEKKEQCGGKRNKRNVWTVPVSGYADAHFATFPPVLIEPCILAGCPVGGTVLDPFGGAGTTGLVADAHQRDAILIELNDTYVDMACKRIYDAAPMFADVC